MTQELSPLDYLLNSFEEATKKDFKGFTFQRSSIIYRAFSDIKRQLDEGEEAKKELEKLESMAKENKEEPVLKQLTQQKIQKKPKKV